MNAQVIGSSAALGSALAWAVGLILLKRIKAQIPALAMTLVTGTLGSALLVIWLLVIGFEPIGWGPLGVLVVSGLLGIALGDTWFFESLDGLSAHLVVLFGVLGQALTLLLAVLVLHETISAAQTLGIALIIMGVFGALSSSDGPTASTRRGIWFGVLSTTAIAVSIIIAKVGMATVSASEATLIRLASGAIGVAIFGLITGRLRRWLGPLRAPGVPRQLGGAVLIGTFGGFLLYHLALKNVAVSVANPLAATEPLFTLPLAAVFLHERVHRRAVLGSVLAVVGVVALAWGS